jgi:hypothetical protein
MTQTGHSDVQPRSVGPDPDAFQFGSIANSCSEVYLYI